MKVLLYIVLLFLSIIQYVMAPIHLQVNFTKIILIILLCSLILFFFIGKKELKGQYLKHSNIFVIGFVIVHFQMYLEYLFGRTDWFGFDYFIDNSIVSKSMCISLIGLLAFFIGYSLINKGFNYRKKKTSKTNSPVFYAAVFYLVLFFYIIFADKRYFRGGYGTYDLGIISEYLQSIILYCFVLYTISVSINYCGTFKNYLWQYKTLALGLFLYLGLVLLSGDRGPIFHFGLCFVGGYLFSTHKKIKMKYFIALTMLGILFFSTLGYLRAIQYSGDFTSRLKESQELRKNLSSVNSVFPPTFEFAKSVRTMHAAVKSTEEDGFHYGLFQVGQLLGIVPGLGTLFKSITGYDNNDLSSAGFLTIQVFGKYPSHGAGTTCVADVYLDFGTFGVFVFFLFLGMFLKKIELTVFIEKYFPIFFWIIALVFFYKAIYLGRSSVLLLLRESIHIYILFYVFKLTNHILKLK